jgi:hypothetical protein
MTLGNAAAAHVRLIVWCKACSHQVEPDPAEMARQYGAGTSVLDWRDRLVCSRCGSRAIDMVVTGTVIRFPSGTADQSVAPPRRLGRAEQLISYPTANEPA